MSTTGMVTIVRTSDSIIGSAKTSSGIMAFCLVAFGIFSLSTLGEDKYPACRAASEKVDYGSGLSISDGTRALIESYRTDWRSLCASKGGKTITSRNLCEG